MRYSVLVPVYNVEQYLDECIQSILNQSLKDFEIILVDDGSTDLSGEICDNYAGNEKITVIHKKNNGLISARRVALQKARGEYIVFCDSDDMLENNALEKIETIIVSEAPDIVLFNMSVLKKGITPFFSHLFGDRQLIDKKEILNELFLNYKYNSLCTKVCKRTIYDIEKDYSAYYTNNYGEDLLQSAPLYINSEKIIYLDDALYIYRYSSGMMRRFNKDYYFSYKAVADNVEKRLLSEDISDLSDKKAVYLLNAAYGHIMQCKYSRKWNYHEIQSLMKDEDLKKAYKRIIANNSKYRNNLLPKQIKMLTYAYEEKKLPLFLLVKSARLKTILIGG